MGGSESWVVHPVPSVGSCRVLATKGKAVLNLSVEQIERGGPKKKQVLDFAPAAHKLSNWV